MTKAVDLFERVRLASMHMEDSQRKLAALEDAYDNVHSWRTKGDGQAYVGAGVSDPTASAAASRMDGLVPAIAKLRADLSEDMGVIGYGLKLIELVRQRLGKSQADTLEVYYIDCAKTWSEVADELGVTLRTVQRYRDGSLGWLDEHVGIMV